MRIPPKLTSIPSFIKIGRKLWKLAHCISLGGVGWLGWLGRSDFFHRLISQADHQDKAPYKISTQYLEAFKSYPIVKFAWGHPTSIRRTYIQHQPLANYSPRRNLFRSGQKVYS